VAWPGGIWEEFGWTAANTAAWCLLAVILGAIARKELLLLSARIARRRRGGSGRKA